MRYCQFSAHDRDCSLPVLPEAPAPICVKHATRVYQYIEDIKRLHEDPDVTVGSRLDKAEIPLACVYYIRFGNRVKIGTSVDLLNRLAALPHDEILAIEPGSYGQEHIRHQQFGHLRLQGEWFHGSDEIRTHVIALREAYGSPLVAWEKWNQERHAA